MRGMRNVDFLPTSMDVTVVLHSGLKPCGVMVSEGVRAA